MPRGIIQIYRKKYSLGWKSFQKNHLILLLKLINCMVNWYRKLSGLWACQIDYDCRIVFTFEKDPGSEKDLIVLVDIGKHDEVY